MPSPAAWDRPCRWGFCACAAAAALLSQNPTRAWPLRITKPDPYCRKRTMPSEGLLGALRVAGSKHGACFDVRAPSLARVARHRAPRRFVGASCLDPAWTLSKPKPPPGQAECENSQFFRSFLHVFTLRCLSCPRETLTRCSAAPGCLFSGPLIEEPSS